MAPLAAVPRRLQNWQTTPIARVKLSGVVPATSGHTTIKAYLHVAQMQNGSHDLEDGVLLFYVYAQHGERILHGGPR